MKKIILLLIILFASTLISAQTDSTKFCKADFMKEKKVECINSFGVSSFSPAERILKNLGEELAITGFFQAKT